MHDDFIELATAAMLLSTLLSALLYLVSFRSAQFKNNYLAEIWNCSEEDSYLKLID